MTENVKKVGQKKIMTENVKKVDQNLIFHVFGHNIF
jgi:hypothetical protein